MSDRDSPTPSRPPWYRVPVRFLLIFGPLLCVSALIVGAVYWQRAKADQTILQLNERDHVKLQSEIIAADFRSVVADLKILAAGQLLQKLLQANAPPRRRDLAEEFHLFLSRKELYDQVRFLDDTGMEIVRVNYRGGKVEIVPPERLQLKKDRYYFTGTMRLGRGEVFVSPFDLNVEEGHLERPLKPTIRFGTPVFDAAGQKRGIVVLNYLGAHLINKLRRHALGAMGDARLLNADGYWLAGPRQDLEWGFMFPDRQQATLTVQSPGTWKRIAAADSGQFRDAGGLYTFRTVYPLQAILEAATGPLGPEARAAPHTYRWKIVSHVTPAVLATAEDRFTQNVLLTCLGLGVVLAIASWFLARLTIQNQDARLRLLQSERLAAVGEAMTALAHECRNALQRSRSGLEMLAKRVGDDSQTRELLDEIQDAQAYLTDLYEEVRGYAAPVHLKRESTDLRQLIEQAWSHAGQPTADANRRLEVQAETDAVCAVDARALSQVLRNLFDNALAATEPGEITVRMAPGRLGGQEALSLTIQDNGPGLSAEERARMFEPFYTTKLHGTGLGLAISRRIVESHGGTLEAADRDGPGATIIMTLPRNTP